MLARLFACLIVCAIAVVVVRRAAVRLLPAEYAASRSLLDRWLLRFSVEISIAALFMTLESYRVRKNRQ